MMSRVRNLRARAASQDGFTIIAALGVLFVTGLILVAAFAIANGDIHTSRDDTTQKQAYYAALAGLQEYEHQLQVNPDYWQTCEGPSTPSLETAGERYEVKVLPASTAPKGTTECNPSNPFATAIESEGALANSFRVKSTGYAKTAGYQGSAKREVIATFQVLGFLDYIYFTNYEQGDPPVFGAPEECEKKTYTQWSSAKLACQEIQFTTGDHVNGPMHTNDTAKVVGEPTFGREGHSPADTVEINGGTRPEEGCEKSTAKYYTATKCFTKGATLEPPENDTSLAAYVEAENEFEGATHLELKGSTIAVTYYNSKVEETKKTISWPKNGLIYVQASKAWERENGCNYKYEAKNSDTSTEPSEEKGCGTVYVSGSYSKSLTVAGENNLIVNGNVYPTALEGKLGNEPSGTVVLGLIASEYIRVYHPCTRSNGNETGSLENPWIYAAILSTNHSFLVDNWECGQPLGELHVYGAIGQNYRGPVGTGSSSSVASGYLKDYKYDGRLATEEPPYFLAPLKAGWKIERQTAPNPG